MKTYYKATVIKTGCLKYRQIDQRNKVKIPDPEIQSFYFQQKCHCNAVGERWSFQ